MKKLLVLALSLMTGFSAFAGPQGEDNGLGLKFFAGLYSWKYGTVDVGLLGAFVDDDEMPKASPTIGLALDNRWYVANPGNAGIAINARWLDFSYASLKEDRETYDAKMNPITVTDKTQYFDASILGIGVIGTYYFDDDMCVDLFYNIMPNVLVLNNKIEGADSDATFAFGASHRIGAAYRFKVFQAGFEIKGGKLKCQDWGKDDAEAAEFNEAMDMANSFFGVGNKVRTGSFRIFLGFKF